jgi:segregation and condensation protein B
MARANQRLEFLEQESKDTAEITLIEAALYVAGRPLDLNTLGSIIKRRSKKRVRSLVETLIQEYENRDTSLEIVELSEDRFVLQLKSEYTSKVQRLAIRPFLTSGPLKTLSYVAYRQPVLQSQVVNVRGNHVYSHLRQLEDMGLITRKKFKRTRELRTTNFFADYFGFSYDIQIMKNQLKKVFKEVS